MFSKKIVALFVFLFSISFVAAQKKEDFKQPRILILLDGSSSMVNEWANGKDRFKVAGNIITNLMDSIYQVNDQVEFSLRVYGHQHNVPENNCVDTRREVMFSKNNITQMSLRLESLRPLGVSPIAYSLKLAAENDFENENDYSYSLILITDGGESCGGDICDVVKNLLEKKIQFKPYIVSLVDYAPLKDQYACLGNYLQVSKPTEMEPAIRTISDAYRKVLAIPVAKPKLQEVKPKPPVSVAKVKTEPVVIPPKEKEPVPIKEEPKPQPAQVANPTSKISVSESAYKRDTFRSIKRINLDKIHYSLFWSTVTPKKRPVPVISLPEKEPLVVAPKPTLVVPPQPKEEKKEASFTIIVEPAPETRLEIYFTDGKGKYYSSTPPMQLLDPKTGKEIKKFFRTTDANGNPDPQIVPPGNFALVIGKKGNFIAKNVTIQPDKSNKVTIVVSKGSLSFAYDANPKRPMTEFIARVKKTFETGPILTQKCTEELEYEPGNYHIEINTLPISVRNVDLEFGSTVRIDIPEPGFVQFTNSNPLGKVSLLYQLGDQFAKFYSIDIKGNPAEQKLRLQPGIYEVRWKKAPQISSREDGLVTFYVKSNETTQVEIQ